MKKEGNELGFHIYRLTYEQAIYISGHMSKRLEDLLHKTNIYSAKRRFDGELSPRLRREEQKVLNEVALVYSIISELDISGLKTIRENPEADTD